MRTRSTRRRAVRLAVLLLTAATAAPVLAHDMWIEPSAFVPQLGELITTRLLVGQDLVGDPLPRNPSLIRQFVVEDPSGRRPVVGRDGGDPAGVVRVAAPGLLVIGYSSNPSRVELPAEKFNQYLVEEGLDAVAGARSRRGKSNRPARELFSRCAKSLVASGPQTASQGDRTLGFPLEIVVGRNPYVLRAGEALPVSLVYEGRPLGGALIVAFNRSRPSDKVRIRTDRDGRAMIPISTSGFWLVKAVHMIAAPSASDADWTSYWASLTFELPAAATTTAVR
jgi:uncharacterized GH25 family protein